MKSSFKRIIVLCTALATSASSLAISTGGAVAAGFGAAAAAGLLFYGIHKSHSRHKNGDKNVDRSSSKTASQRDMKKDLKKRLNAAKKDHKSHKLELRKLERKGKAQSPEAQQHRTFIQNIESDIERMEAKLKQL